MEENLVRNENGVVCTTSLVIAESFKKKHKHVLESIRKIMNSANFLAQFKTSDKQMFIESTYIASDNSKRPMYYVTRDGFSLLAMGYNGEDAMKFKIDYIEAFNKMEEIVKTHVTKPQQQLSPAEFLLQQAQLMVEQEKRISAVEQNVSEIASRLNDIDEERKENAKLLLSERIDDAMPVPSLRKRDKVRKLINLYASFTNTFQKDIWHAIYDRLYYNYRVSANQIQLVGSESRFDALVRNGHLDKIYSIICDMCRNRGISTNGQ